MILHSFDDRVETVALGLGIGYRQNVHDLSAAGENGFLVVNLVASMPLSTNHKRPRDPLIELLLERSALTAKTEAKRPSWYIADQLDRSHNVSDPQAGYRSHP
jgi:hypothetical protein